MHPWTIQDSLELYGVPAWGAGHFAVNDAGHVVVRPRGADGPGIDLLDLVGDLERRGMRTPLLIRFSDILASQIHGLAAAFRQAIENVTDSHRGTCDVAHPGTPSSTVAILHETDEVIRYLVLSDATIALETATALNTGSPGMSVGRFPRR